MTELLDLLIVEHLTQRVIFFIERFGYHHLDIIENVNDAISYLNDNLYDYIFLGGDLGKESGSCVDVAKYLVYNEANPNLLTNIIIHSWSVADANQMVRLLPHAQYLPYNEKQLSVLEI